MLTQQELHNLIDYNPNTGLIVRKTPTTTHQQIGQVEQRKYITFYCKAYSTVQVIWKHMYGYVPDGVILTLDGTDQYHMHNLHVTGAAIPMTQENLRRFLNYDGTTGIFTIKSRYTTSQTIGHETGTVSGTLPDGGYVGISVFGKRYSAHRLAWFYTYGVWPDQIDHIDHNRQNNMLINLRETTNKVNMKNKTMYKTNTTGYAGVKPCNSGWRAVIGSTPRIHLGVFETMAEAIAARQAAEKILNYHANHGSIKV